MSTNTNFSTWIKTARAARGWTQKQLEEAAGIGDGMASHIESARRHPSVDIVVALAEALDLSAREALTAAGYIGGAEGVVAQVLTSNRPAASRPRTVPVTKGVLVVDLPPELFAELVELARSLRISRDRITTDALELHLAQWRKKPELVEEVEQQ